MSGARFIRLATAFCATRRNCFLFPHLQRRCVVLWLVLAFWAGCLRDCLRSVRAGQGQDRMADSIVWMASNTSAANSTTEILVAECRYATSIEVDFLECMELFCLLPSWSFL